LGKDESSNRNQQYKMHNYCKTIGALAAVSALVAGNASAEVEYELHTGYTSEYLFRGINYGQDLIEVGADVKGELYGLGLSAGAWYGTIDNMQAAGTNSVGFNELDLYGQATKDFGFATFGVGYISRQYDADSWGGNVFLAGRELDGDTEQEVYFSVAREFWGIETSLTYFWDIETDNDGYTELAMKKGWELNPCLWLNASGNLGYLAEQGQLTALTLKTSLDWGFASTAKLSPFVAYSMSLSDDNDTLYWGAKDQFVGGVMLSVGF
jgi:hypothetical protein